MTTDIQILNEAQAANEVGALTPRKTFTQEYMHAMLGAYNLFENAVAGSYLAKHRLQEALTRSDFPKIFGSALDVKLLAAYQAIAPVWTQFATRDVVPDFRASTWVDLLGGQGAFDLVKEGAPYPRATLSEGDGSYTVAKYGKTVGLTWEMFKDDRLHAFLTLPNRLAVAAREMEDRIATAQLVIATGPNPALFGAAKVKGKGGVTSSNLMAGNPALSETSLEAALLAISLRRDFDDRPVVLNGAVLVVPPALQTTAERIVGATEVREQVGSKLIVRTNPLAGRVKVAVNPWIPTIDVSANAATSWSLLPEPAATGRPAVVLGFLAGHENPDLRVKNDQGTRVGGGAIAPEEGSFEFDTIDYRGRHVLGGGPVDANSVIFSNGSGS
jgi:hypothetical protein